MIKSTLSSALVVFLFLLTIFPLLEFRLAYANPTTVVAKQQVTAEISMTVASTTMVLLPAIAGLTGGTGNASTSISVITNNKTGYSVTVQGTTTVGALSAMRGDTTNGRFNDYASTTPVTWSSTSAGQASQFGFGITNGTLSSANGASGYTTCTGVESCWRNLATTTAVTVVNVNTFTPVGGDNFFLKFRAHVPANSNPLVPQDWYTATATVTAVTN